MDKEELEQAYLVATAEASVTTGPDDLVDRLRQLHDLDIDLIFEHISSIATDAALFAIDYPPCIEEMGNKDTEVEKMAVLMTTVVKLSSQRSFFSGYFLAKERFENASNRG